jgi:chitinase
MHTRKLVIAASIGTLVAGAGAATISLSGSASASASYSVAPYVDLSANSSTMLGTAISQAGLTSYTAAFVIGSGCTPIWGDTLGIDNSGATTKIAAAKAAGASAIISFGGAGGVELGQSCTDTGSLTTAYQSVITKYGVDHIDFDIEGAAIADTASINRRYQAIKALESANPNLNVSLTIPVLPSGPDGNGSAFLKAAVSNGVRVDMVNAMTMDYGSAVSDMATAAETAAAGTLSAARSAGLNLGYANIGITPMIGNNDSAGEVVSQANAQTIVAWAKSNGIGRLSFWSIGRDQPCAGGGVSPNCSGLGGSALDFTKIFLAGSGGTTTTSTSSSSSSSSSGSPSSTGSGGTTSGTGTTGATSWVAGHAYRVGDVVTYNGVTYTCLQSHTSLTGWEPPNTPALWNPTATTGTATSTGSTGSTGSTSTSGSGTGTTTAPTGATSWVAGHAYVVRDVVTYNGVTYTCLQSHTSLTGWEPPNTPALWKQS